MEENENEIQGSDVGAITARARRAEITEKNREDKSNSKLSRLKRLIRAFSPDREKATLR